MIELPPELLHMAMMGCTSARAAIWAQPLEDAMALFDISTPVRAADFIAQVGHESLGLQFTSEIWGPDQVPAQRTYERDFAQPWGDALVRGDRNFKAFTLGNLNVGDGRAFAGHGPIQITGRRNHAKARDALQELTGAPVPDFEADPKALTLPKWGALAAGQFWHANNLNALADSGDFVTQTRRINGGTNGLADRQARRDQARVALGLVP